MRFKTVFCWVILFGLLLLSNQCMYYSFSGSMAPHLRSIAIPMFENRTAEFGIAEELTDYITQEFTQDNTLKIADAGDADVLLNGTIISVEERAGGFTDTEQVQDMKVYLTVAVRCIDQVKKLDLWEQRLTQWGSFEPGGGVEDRAAAVTQAIEKISQEILNKTVSGW
ncbi:MAG TPA: LptE family protein [bacterium]|jgi:hypothetical protein|nr:LptE family protein [bacterium]HPM98132.1 LptE family protein [bacterium]